MLFYVYRNNHLYAAYILCGKLMRENIMSSSVAALADLLFAANAIPTWKNSRSTAAEDAGQLLDLRPLYLGSVCSDLTLVFNNTATARPSLYCSSRLAAAVQGARAGGV